VTNPNLSARSLLPLPLVVILAITLGSVLTIAALVATGLLRVPNRQGEVAARGAQIMPFDLEQTTHVFQLTNDGALQQVVVKDRANTAQIALIQGHLQEEAARFARGNFSSPAAIHGQDMAGLAALEASADKLDVQYTLLPHGGQIRYTTTDPQVRHALHQWIAAQLSDHGHHATDGH
jgi:hypothetical protein